jgi:hypothetical protein
MRRAEPQNHDLESQKFAGACVHFPCKVLIPFMVERGILCKLMMAKELKVKVLITKGLGAINVNYIVNFCQDRTQKARNDRKLRGCGCPPMTGNECLMPNDRELTTSKTAREIISARHTPCSMTHAPPPDTPYNGPPLQPASWPGTFAVIR